MKTSIFIKALIAASFAALSLGVNAATIQLGNAYSYVSPTGKTATVNTVLNIDDYMTGASQGYYVSGATPNSLDGDHLQLALNAVDPSFAVTDFTQASKSKDNVFDSSSLGIAFQGFLMKVGNFTLIGLFNNPITQLAYSNDGLKGLAQVAYFNTTPAISEVPVPAALWLFAPAMASFLAFRRRFTSKA